MPGATINDVTLAYVGGALRHYLQGHGELPDEDLVAACPASIRSTDERGAGGNRLFGRLHMLGTAIADPLERLARSSSRPRRTATTPIRKATPG